jgi:hypothetical protein
LYSFRLICIILDIGIYALAGGSVTFKMPLSKSASI